MITCRAAMMPAPRLIVSVLRVRLAGKRGCVGCNIGIVAAIGGAACKDIGIVGLGIGCGLTKVAIRSSFRLACSNAFANVCTVGKRWCGSLASAVLTTFSIAGEIIGFFTNRGVGDA